MRLLQIMLYGEERSENAELHIISLVVPPLEVPERSHLGRDHRETTWNRLDPRWPAWAVGWVSGLGVCVRCETHDVTAGGG